jgi:cystathionine gamma-lyase
VTFVDTTDVARVVAAFKPNTKMLWLETPTNPTLKVSDIAALAAAAHAHNPAMLVVVDNTFLSPYLQRPLELGADIVSHSVSKYINGHSDVVMGVLAIKSTDVFTRLKFLQNAIGSIPSPFDCYMAHRGLKTLAVRMERHCRSAQRIAAFLEAHPKIARVAYPGLKSHPQHDIATRQQSGYGGMITFWLKGDLTHARQFLEAIKGPFTLAESLGGIESLIEHPAIMTHASVPAEQRAQLGISDSLVRVSVGIEDVEDIENDLKQALEHVHL